MTIYITCQLFINQNNTIILIIDLLIVCYTYDPPTNPKSRILNDTEQ